MVLSVAALFWYLLLGRCNGLRDEVVPNFEICASKCGRVHLKRAGICFIHGHIYSRKQAGTWRTLLMVRPVRYGLELKWTLFICYAV